MAIDNAEPFIHRVISRTRYDEERGELVWLGNYSKGVAGKRVGTSNREGYLMTKIGPYTRPLHRVIWRLHFGEWPDGYLDHINGVRNDNRIANLRLVTPLGNQQNIKLPVSNTTGFLGVRHERSTGRWRAAIKFQRKTRYLGTFDTAELAHQAYLEAKKRLHRYNPVPRENYDVR